MTFFNSIINIISPNPFILIILILLFALLFTYTQYFHFNWIKAKLSYNIFSIVYNSAIILYLLILPIIFSFFLYTFLFNIPPIILSIIKNQTFILVIIMTIFAIIISYLNNNKFIQWSKNTNSEHINNFFENKFNVLLVSILLILIATHPANIYLLNPMANAEKVEMYEIQPFVDDEFTLFEGSTLLQNSSLIIGGNNSNNNSSSITSIDINKNVVNWSQFLNSPLMQLIEIDDSSLLLTNEKSKKYSIVKSDFGNLWYTIEMDKPFLESTEGLYSFNEKNVYQFDGMQWIEASKYNPIEEAGILDVKVINGLSVYITAEQIIWYDMDENKEIDRYVYLEQPDSKSVKNVELYALDNNKMLVFKSFIDDTIEISYINGAEKKIEWTDITKESNILRDSNDKIIINYNNNIISYRYGQDENENRTISIFDIKNGRKLYNLPATFKSKSFEDIQKIKILNNNYIALYDLYHISLFNAENGQSLSNIWFTDLERLTVEDRKGSISEVISNIDSKLAFNSEPIYYNNRIYWTNVSGEIYVINTKAFNR